MRPLRLTDTNRAAGTAGKQQVKIGILYASALQTLASAQARHNVRYSSSRRHFRYRYYAHQHCGIASRRRSEPRHSAAALHRHSTAAPTALTFLTAWMRASDNKP